MIRWSMMALALTATGASAAPFEPKMKDVCTIIAAAPGARPELDRQKLVGQLLKHKGLHPIDLDTHGNGATFERQKEAILDPGSFCGPAGACGEDVADALGEAQIELFAFLQRHRATVPSGGSGYQIQRRDGSPISDETSFRQYLKGDEAILAQCVLPQPATAEKAAQPPFVVRKKVDDLSLGQKSQAFKKLERASVSIADDRLKDSQAFGVEGVVGYRLRNWAGENGELSLLPYVGYTRQYVDGPNPKKIGNVDNFSFGLLGDLSFDAFGVRQVFQVYPELVHSNRSGAEVLSINGVYAPEPAWTGFSQIRYLIEDRLSYKITPSLKLAYGSVLDDGGDAELRDSDSFGRIGPSLSLVFYGEGKHLGGFSLGFSYDLLKVFDGPHDAIRRFEGALSYEFPEQKFWGVQLKYADGRNLSTLERQRLLTFGIGFKF